MKYLLILFLGILSFFVFTFTTYAQSGCCSWHGGESYCDSTTGRWVCSDGTYSPTCTCGGYQSPAYIPPPSCPLNSYYNGSSCTCYSGYVSNGSSCISVQQYCWNTLGTMSQYNYGNQRCECMTGYVYSNGSCISGTTSCWNQYGYNSSYQSFSNSCICNVGYTWNSSKTKCISEDEVCQGQLGIMSRYNSISNTCDCLTGYSIQGGQCLPNPTQKIIVPSYRNTNNIIKINNTPTPSPITKKINLPTPTPSAQTNWFLRLILGLL